MDTAENLTLTDKENIVVLKARTANFKSLRLYRWSLVAVAVFLFIAFLVIAIKRGLSDANIILVFYVWCVVGLVYNEQKIKFYIILNKLTASEKTSSDDAL